MYKAIYIDDSKIKYKNKEYQLNIAFNRMLKAIDLIEDKSIDEAEKVEYLFDCFIDGKTKLSIYDKSCVVNKILEHTNSFFDDIKSKKTGEKVMDIKKDFEYIYSSFYMDYKIDLLDELDKLSWIKFKALLNGLSKNTKMSEVIKIRTTKIPAPNGNNQEYRQNIIELKNLYSLDAKEENFQEGLNDLFNILKGISK